MYLASGCTTGTQYYVYLETKTLALKNKSSTEESYCGSQWSFNSRKPRQVRNVLAD